MTISCMFATLSVNVVKECAIPMKEKSTHSKCAKYVFANNKLHSK